MIKLVDLINEDNQIEEAGAKDFALGALATIGSMVGGSAKAAPPTDSTGINPAAAKVALAKFGQDKTTASSQVLGADVLSQWDELRSWLEKTTVNDIDGSGDKSKLMGNPKLDNTNPKTDNFNAKMVAAYKKAHPKSSITNPETVKKIQQAIVNHRNGTIVADGTESITLHGGAYRGTNYSTYLPHVSKIEQKAKKEGDVDGIIGQYTSQVQIPRDLRSNPTAIYAQTPVKEHKMTKQQLREVIRHLIKKELNEINRFSPKTAFEKDIQSDPDYIDLKIKAATRDHVPEEVPHASKRDYFIDDRFKDIEKFGLEDDDDELAENQPKPATKPKPGETETIPRTEPRPRPLAPGQPIKKPGHVPDKEPAKAEKARSLKKENESARAKIIDRLKNKR